MPAAANTALNEAFISAPFEIGLPGTSSIRLSHRLNQACSMFAMSARSLLDRLFLEQIARPASQGSCQVGRRAQAAARSALVSRGNQQARCADREGDRAVAGPAGAA